MVLAIIHNRAYLESARALYRRDPELAKNVFGNDEILKKIINMTNNEITALSNQRTDNRILV
jgi:hypothetical protein